MNNSIQINNQTFAIEYYPATVVHSDKYNETNYFTFNNYNANTPSHDITFRENQTGHEFFFTVEYSKMKAYVGQNVDLITLDKKIIGYVSNSTNNYYYLTNQFAKILQLGIHWKWIVSLEISLAISLYFNTDYSLQNYLIGFFFFIPIVYRVGMRFFNLYIEKKIDKVVSKS